MMYKQTVVHYCKAKYTKASNELLEQVFHNEHSYISSDGKKTFAGQVVVHCLAKANGLQLSSIPTVFITFSGDTCNDLSKPIYVST